jgi:hypothetical protein
MGNIINKFENETKTRINVIDFENSQRFELQKIVIKNGIFEETDFMRNDNFVSFPTEILCSSAKNNFVSVYLSIKNEHDIIEELKDNILKSLHEVCLNLNNDVIDEYKKNNDDEFEELKKSFYNTLNCQITNTSLNKFYEVDNIQKVFKTINFSKLFKELEKINYSNDLDILEKEDDYVWRTYFNDFKTGFEKHYYKWMKMISNYYAENEDGHEYMNEDDDSANKYSNKDFKVLCNMLYGINSSCSLMIDRAYIKVPSSKPQYLGIVFIDYPKDKKYRNIAKIVESRVSEDYKELFMIVSKCSDKLEHFSEIKENIDTVTLNKRIFCVLNEFDSYRKRLLKYGTGTDYVNNEEDLIDTLRGNAAKKIGISQERVIVTEQFKDINKRTLESLNTRNDFLQLLRLIRKESESVGKAIKIKPSNKEKLINISLNQERMIVQALMGMLYERYNGYLVELWNKIIDDENEQAAKEYKKYSYSEINTIIRNRKDNYKEYKYTAFSKNNQRDKKPIDFSLRSGDYNDSKKILKMLVSHGYQTIGFDSNVNKILVNVNGEISKEDKDKLIKSIKGRLEENAIDYFENAFLMTVSRKKFNTTNLYKALEIEKNITIDDFYSAFKEMFKKICDNIIRYEVCLQ